MFSKTRDAVTITQVNVRTLPIIPINQHSNVLFMLDPNYQVTVLSQGPVSDGEHDWVFVSTGRSYGWVATENLRMTQPGQSVPAMPVPTVNPGPVNPAGPVKLPVPPIGAWSLPFTASQRGVGASAGGWSPDDRQIGLVKNNRIETVLICTYEPGQAGSAIARFRGAGVRNFIIRACTHEKISNADKFVADTLPTLKEYARALGGSDGMMIAVHNEPNLTTEGLNSAWGDGFGFVQWWRVVSAQYRRELPGCRLGFPALSPGVGIPGLRYAEDSFIRQCMAGVSEADWVGVHYYWEDSAGADINPPVATWRAYFGRKPLVGTEVGPADHTSVTRGAVLRAYDAFARYGIPIMSWLLNGAGTWANAAWDTNNLYL